MGVATLALCRFASSWSHTSARVTGLQPFALVSAHPRHARHWSHHRISGVDCTASHDPTNRPYCLVRPRAAGPSVSCASPPTRPAPARCLRGRPSSVLRPDQSLHLSTGEPPATSWIFPARHFHIALVFITPSVDHARPLRRPSFAGRHCSQIFRSTEGREGCQGCGASPEFRNQMLRPRRAVRRRPVLGQRETRFPK